MQPLFKDQLMKKFFGRLLFLFSIIVSGGLLFIFATMLSGGLISFSSSPRYEGPFNWNRVVIGQNANLGGTDSKVFESIEMMKTIFSLQAGDECFYLNSKEWIWRDQKDPFFSLVPIFCPKKGGGWAMPHGD